LTLTVARRGADNQSPSCASDGRLEALQDGTQSFGEMAARRLGDLVGQTVDRFGYRPSDTSECVCIAAKAHSGSHNPFPIFRLECGMSAGGTVPAADTSKPPRASAPSGVRS
jgi:hypothetical protein